MRVKYEELMDDPNATVYHIFDWLGLDTTSFSGIEDMDFEHGNVKYMKQFCGYLKNPKAVEEVDYIVKIFEAQVQRFGYSLQSWKDACGKRPSIPANDGEDVAEGSPTGDSTGAKPER